jgi:hypothetical protein
MSSYRSGAPPKENPGGEAGVSEKHTQHNERQHSDHSNGWQVGRAPLHLHDFAARFKVARFSCVLSIRDGRILVEWDPMPRQLSRAELAEYRSRRNAALVEFAHDSGIRITVFDV